MAFPTITITSDPYPLDTQPPGGISPPLNVTVITGSSMECVWSEATDQTFDRYEIWYGTDQSDVINRTGTAQEWGLAQDANLAVRSTITTTVTGLAVDTAYYFSIFAIDAFEQTTRVDASGTIAIVAESVSGAFVLDTIPPRDTSFLALNAINTTDLECTWNEATDGFFSHYELWYGPNDTDVQNRTGSATEWGPIEDPNLSNIATVSTTITGLTPGVTYFVSIFVIDQIGNTLRIDALSPERTFDIFTAKFDGRIFLYDARTKKGDGRLKVFQTNPLSFFGRFWVYDFTTEKFDGFTWIVDGRTFKFDGKVKVFKSNPNNFQGRLRIYDFTTELFDARVFTHRVGASQYDGHVYIVEDVLEVFDSKVHVGHEHWRTMKTRFHVGIDTTAELPFRVVITLHLQLRADGRLYIVETVQTGFDGAVSIESVKRGDGKLWVKEIDAPFLISLDPSRNQLNVPFEPDIHFEIVDRGPVVSGVDLTSVNIRLYIDNVLAGEFRYTGTKGADKYPLIRVTGDPTHYVFHMRFFLPGIQPFIRFEPGSIITVEVDAEDFSENRLEDRYNFVIETLDAEFSEREPLIWTSTDDFKFNLEYGIRYPEHDNAEPVTDLLRLISRTNSEEE